MLLCTTKRRKNKGMVKALSLLPYFRPCLQKALFLSQFVHALSFQPVCGSICGLLFPYFPYHPTMPRSIHACHAPFQLPLTPFVGYKPSILPPPHEPSTPPPVTPQLFALSSPCQHAFVCRQWFKQTIAKATSSPLRTSLFLFTLVYIYVSHTLSKPTTLFPQLSLFLNGECTLTRVFCFA
ncbi:MAG: hypothetical protein J3R72DRAFT_253551 [Linnemannia gamsii]|nr:MAG: hypothetical protein J3R72DRAFT_253551 [Linnemannia gamsii]